MHLTYHDSERHTGTASPARAKGDGAPEIEITPEMIEAGTKIIFEFREELMASTLAERVYRAMEQDKINRRKIR